jgi:hypothetical protein
MNTAIQQMMWTKFNNNGYHVTQSISTGNILVTPPSNLGFRKCFENIEEAFRYYFDSL